MKVKKKEECLISLTSSDDNVNTERKADKAHNMAAEDEDNNYTMHTDEDDTNKDNDVSLRDIGDSANNDDTEGDVHVNHVSTKKH